MKPTVITFRTDEDFRAHLEDKARENHVTVGEYIRTLLKKGSKYKEKKTRTRMNRKTSANLDHENRNL